MPDESQTPEEILPDIIIDGLRELDRVPFDVSAEQHNDILKNARQHLKPVNRPRPVRRWRYIVAVTGSVCAALLIFVVTRPTSIEQPVQQASAIPRQADMASKTPFRNPKDIDADGKVDILDAYAMARRLQSNDFDGSLSEWDFNSDGQLDEEDIQMVAFEAVML